MALAGCSIEAPASPEPPARLWSVCAPPPCTPTRPPPSTSDYAACYAAEAGRPATARADRRVARAAGPWSVPRLHRHLRRPRINRHTLHRRVWTWARTPEPSAKATSSISPDDWSTSTARTRAAPSASRSHSGPPPSLSLVPASIPADEERYPCTECGDLGVESVVCLCERGRMLAGMCRPPVSAVQTRCR